MKIIIPESYNYIGVFLTLRCNLKCEYCINSFNGNKIYGRELTGEEWIYGLNRLQTREDLPVSLQGGEPTLHKDFYIIVGGVNKDINIDLMTNLQFNIHAFMNIIKPVRISRKAPYASIRVSYHPGQQDYIDLIAKVKLLMDSGYSIGIWSVWHPDKDKQKQIEYVKEMAEARGIDFRLKEFLGEYNGKMYGDYKYPDALNSEHTALVKCKTTELLIGPDGNIYRCHSDLYSHSNEIGHILDPNFEIKDIYRECARYGECNPCDIKIKTNRFQKHGHTSVDIKEIK